MIILYGPGKSGLFVKGPAFPGRNLRGWGREFEGGGRINHRLKTCATYPWPPPSIPHSCLVLATVRTSTRDAPALSRARAHSLTVAPVV